MMTVNPALSTFIKFLLALDARMVSYTLTQRVGSRGAYQVAHIIIKQGLVCLGVKHLMLGVY
jgi:hypothetical protein